jgi:hypothetical protein
MTQHTNTWTNHDKAYAKDKGITYKSALQDPNTQPQVPQISEFRISVLFRSTIYPKKQTSNK